MKLPTEQQCLDLFAEYQVFHNIIKHCQKVQQVSLFLAQELQKSGEPLDIELVSRLALLHDLFKAVTIKDLKPTKHHPYQPTAEEIAMWEKLRAKYSGKYENEIAYEILQEDYPEFSLALKHEGDPQYDQKSPEEALVHYTDARVLKENIVTLQERFIYLKEVYPKDEKYWGTINTKIVAYEQKLFSKLPFSPEQLKQRFEEHHGR